jgi:hypothetical protein
MKMSPQPTPTQEENDLAATGQHVQTKESDGSSLDEAANPPQEVDVVATEQKKKQMEAKPAPAAAGYQTRQAQPAGRRPAPPE